MITDHMKFAYTIPTQKYSLHIMLTHYIQTPVCVYHPHCLICQVMARIMAIADAAELRAAEGHTGQDTDDPG